MIGIIICKSIMNSYKLIQLKKETSNTFCLAKFHEATIWLYNSRMSSCHHTPTVILGDTIETFYNPEEKRQQQDEMLKGIKPSACNYCWNLEKQNLKSDRELKSLSFKSHLNPTDYLNRNYNFKPKALELAFQNTCNLACSYCSPVYSTEWINDIKKHGVYTNIATDAKNHYYRGIDPSMPVNLDLFWTWFTDVVDDLESLRITGGEPLLHNETFQTFEMIVEKNPNIECVVATNLCQKELIITRFIGLVNKLGNVRLNISNESAGEVAEFIRDGMDYNQWLHNVERLAKETKATLSISTTITALSLISLDKLFLDIIKLRKNLNNKPSIAINIATYPEFQSIQSLSYDERVFYYNKYNDFYNVHKGDLLDYEAKVFSRLTTLLDPKLLHEKHLDYKKDFISFFKQYIIRRNKTDYVLNLLGKQ